MNEFNPKERTLARENILKILYQYDITGYTFRDIEKYLLRKEAMMKFILIISYLYWN